MHWNFSPTPCGGTGPASPPCRSWSGRGGPERLHLEIVAPVCARPAVIPSLVVGNGLVVSGGAQCFGESVRQAKYHAVRKALLQDGGESIVVTVPNQRILGDGAVPRVLRSFENTANVGAGIARRRRIQIRRRERPAATDGNPIGVVRSF